MDPRIAQIEADIVHLRGRERSNADGLRRLSFDAAALATRMDRLERQLESAREMRFYTWSTIAAYALAAVIFGLLWHGLGWI
jgi:hypothetical protein